MGREYSPVWSAIKGALTVNICCDHLVLVLGGGLERPLRLLAFLADVLLVHGVVQLLQQVAEQLVILLLGFFLVLLVAGLAASSTLAAPARADARAASRAAAASERAPARASAGGGQWSLVTEFGRRGKKDGG